MNLGFEHLGDYVVGGALWRGALERKRHHLGNRSVEAQVWSNYALA
jgi:hypothetical protein